MWYAKNLPTWERALRTLCGLALIAFGLLALPGLMLGYALAGAGVVTLVTGLVGFCPMCALAGRRAAKP